MPRHPRLSTRAAYTTLASVHAAVLGLPLAHAVWGLAHHGPRAVVLTPHAQPSLLVPGWALYVVPLAVAALCVWSVCRMRLHLGLGQVFAPESELGQDAEQDRTAQRWRSFALATAASVLSAAVVVLLGARGPGPVIADALGPGSVEVLTGVLLAGLAHGATALIAGVVGLALVVLALSAARREPWEIYVIAVVAQILAHPFGGIAALGLAPAAGLSVWLYRRTGRLWPLIAAHGTASLALALLVSSTAPL